MAIFVVEERFEPAIDAQALNPYSDALSPCLKTYDVAWVSSFVARDGSQCVCVYEAPDADSVRRAYRTAEVPFQFRVWAATQYVPEASMNRT